MSGVIVLGMHRSGTSAVARLLGLLGLDPAAGDLMPPDEHNAKGYWESTSLVAFNDEVLVALGCSWSCPPPLAGWRPEEAPELVEAARARFGSRFERPGWVWKDPRACLTLPLWRRALDAEPALVVVLRNPLEVAASLAARDGFGKRHALALWERYVRHAVAAARGLPAYVLDYSEVLDDPVSCAGRLCAFLAAHGRAASPPDEAAVRGFVDPSLRRRRAAAVEEDRDVSGEQVALVRALDRLRGSHDALDPVALPPETPGLDWTIALHLQDELARARARAEAAEHELAYMLDSRTFRYTAPARRIAAVLLRARAARATSTPRAADSRS